MSGLGNRIKTITLMGVMTILVILIGGAFGGQGGMMMAFVFALAMNGVSYWFSDKIALSMTKSHPVTREEQPELYFMVEQLAERAEIPTPRVYISDSHQPNAFATGRNPENSAVAVTSGLLHILNREELEGVIAHELAHIKNRDVLISTVTAVMAGVITMIAQWAQWALIFGGSNDEEDGGGLAALPMIILGPIAATLVQMAVSRSREYLADSTGAEIAGNPHGLANALLKLERGSSMIPMQVNPAASHLFIVNPLNGQRIVSLFSTHPPIQERVKKLNQMSI